MDGRGRERLSVAREVEREEEDDEYLGELTGLEGERPDEDPQLGSVDLRADEHRKKQESDADDAERVLVVREVVEVAHEEERGDHETHERLAYERVSLALRLGGDEIGRLVGDLLVERAHEAVVCR